MPDFFEQFNLDITGPGGEGVSENDVLEAISSRLNNTSTNIRTGTGRQVRLKDLLVGTGTALFGDGSDGDVRITGNTTLSRDMLYNSVVIEDGVEVDTGGFRIFASDFIRLEGTAKVKRNGNDGSVGTAGNNNTVCGTNSTGGAGGAGATGVTGATLGGSEAGSAGGAGGDGDGSNGTNGTDGTAVANTLVGNGVAGGAGGAGAGDSKGSGGSGGAAGAGTNTGSSIARYPTCVELQDALGFFTASAGSGGGAGGGGAGNSVSPASQAGGGGGGGSGANAGVVLLSSPRIIIEPGSTLDAIGGDGGAGGAGGDASGCGVPDGNRNYGGGGGGGGAGGNGGVVVFVYSQSLQNNGTIDVSGGTGGAGGAGGTATVSGSVGSSGSNGASGSNFSIAIGD